MSKLRALEGGADDPFAKCQAICAELAVEIQKNVLEVPSLSSERSESATKATVRTCLVVKEISHGSIYFNLLQFR
jgi:hypothetical protein